jgi:hypothetical protein
MSSPSNEPSAPSPADRIATMRSFLGRLSTPPSTSASAHALAHEFGGEPSFPVLDLSPLVSLRDPGGGFTGDADDLIRVGIDGDADDLISVSTEVVNEMARRLESLLFEEGEAYSGRQIDGLITMNDLITESHDRRHRRRRSEFLMAARAREAAISNLVHRDSSSSSSTDSSTHDDSSSSNATPDDLPGLPQRGEGNTVPPSCLSYGELFNGRPLWDPRHAYGEGDYEHNEVDMPTIRMSASGSRWECYRQSAESPIVRNVPAIISCFPVSGAGTMSPQTLPDPSGWGGATASPSNDSTSLSPVLPSRPPSSRTAMATPSSLWTDLSAAPSRERTPVPLLSPSSKTLTEALLLDLGIGSLPIPPSHPPPAASSAPSSVPPPGSPSGLPNIPTTSLLLALGFQPTTTELPPHTSVCLPALILPLATPRVESPFRVEDWIERHNQGEGDWYQSQEDDSSMPTLETASLSSGEQENKTSQDEDSDADVLLFVPAVRSQEIETSQDEDSDADVLLFVPAVRSQEIETSQDEDSDADVLSFASAHRPVFPAASCMYPIKPRFRTPMGGLGIRLLCGDKSNSLTYHNNFSFATISDSALDLFGSGNSGVDVDGASLGSSTKSSGARLVSTGLRNISASFNSNLFQMPATTFGKPAAPPPTAAPPMFGKPASGAAPEATSGAPPVKRPFQESDYVLSPKFEQDDATVYGMETEADGTNLDEPLFAVFRFEGSVDGLCSGMVGSNSFCAKLLGECTTKKHKVVKQGVRINKIELDPGYYMCSVKGRQAPLTRPFLPLAVADVSSIFQTHRNELLPRRNWLSIISVVLEQHNRPISEGDSFANPEEDGNEFIESTKGMPTPRRKRIKFISGDESDGFDNPDVRAMMARMKQHFDAWEEDMKSMSFAVRFIQAELGSPSLEARQDQSTIWASIEGALFTLGQHTDEFIEAFDLIDAGGFEAKRTSTDLREYKAKLDEYVLKGDQLALDISSAATVASEARLTADRARSTLETFRNTGGFGAVQNLATRVSHTESQLSEASVDFANMTALIEQLVAVRPPVHSPPGASSVSQAEHNTDVAKLKEHIDELRQHSMGGGVKMAGHHFKSYADTLPFVQTHFPPKSYQGFVDIMSLLQRIEDVCRYSSDIQSQEIHSAKVDRLPEQSVVVASFQTGLPQVLNGPREAHESTKLFAAMKDADAWDPGDGTTGTLNRINASLTMRVESVRNMIEHIYEAHPVARQICIEMLNSTASFWRELCAEISEFYRFLLVSSYGNDVSYTTQAKQQCWTVVLKMLRVFFSELHKRRIVAEHGYTSPDANAIYFWGTLQAHSVMEEFRRARFHEHPKVYPQIVIFLFKTYVSKSEIQRIRDVNVDLSRRCVAAETELTTVKRSYDALVTRVLRLEQAGGITCGGGGGGGGGGGLKRKGKKGDVTEIA